MMAEILIVFLKGFIQFQIQKKKLLMFAGVIENIREFKLKISYELIIRVEKTKVSDRKIFDG